MYVNGVDKILGTQCNVLAADITSVTAHVTIYSFSVWPQRHVWKFFNDTTIEGAQDKFEQESISKLTLASRDKGAFEEKF